MLFGSLLIPRLAQFLQKKRAKKREAYRIKKYTEYVESCEKKVKELVAKQTQILRDTNLNINGCINLLNTSNYWNREIKDEDFLIVRTGIGNVTETFNAQFIKNVAAVSDFTYTVINWVVDKVFFK
jgi:DNA segregation ATPase FtsK/SpoIIIE-like protein